MYYRAAVFSLIFGENWANIKTGINYTEVRDLAEFKGEYIREQWTEVFKDKRGISVGMALGSIVHKVGEYNSPLSSGIADAIFLACLKATGKTSGSIPK
jgi:hypothetical protein